MDTLVLWVALILFLWLIRNVVRDQILPALDARGDRIRNELDEAQRLREEAQAMLQKYRTALREGEDAAEAIAKRSAEDAALLEDKMRKELEAAVERRTKQATDRIAQEEAKARADVQARAADLSARTTRRLLEQRLDGAQADALMRDAIREVEAKLA